MKKNCIVKTLKQPTDVHSDNEFSWEFFEGNKSISKLSIKLTNKKEKDETRKTGL